MTISEIFNLPILGHEDIEFIDIDEQRDTELYIDPYVIEAYSDSFCNRAHECISTFFLQVFNACKDRDHERLRYLLSFASEPNETNLGMKRISRYGKGSTANELMSLFFEFYNSVKVNSEWTSRPLIMCMYIKHFDKDHMSDLITNIIRHLLVEFTIEQCSKWDIELTSKNEFLGYYWDSQSLRWKEMYGPALSIDGGHNLLLVPKYIVRKNYVYDIERYIKQYVLKERQMWHLTNNTDLCYEKEYANGRKKTVAPSIKELYEKEVHGQNHKEYAQYYSHNNARSEVLFMNDMLRRIRNGYGYLTDEELDRIIYGHKAA